MREDVSVYAIRMNHFVNRPRIPLPLNWQRVGLAIQTTSKEPLFPIANTSVVPALLIVMEGLLHWMGVLGP